MIYYSRTLIHTQVGLIFCRLMDLLDVLGGVRVNYLCSTHWTNPRRRQGDMAGYCKSYFMVVHCDANTLWLPYSLA